MSSEPKPRFLRTSLALSLTITTVAVGLAEVGQRLAGIGNSLREQEKQQFEQEQQDILNRAKAFAAAGHYPDCIAEAEKVRADAIVYSLAQSCLHSCQNHLAAAWLEQAKRRADQGELVAAIGDAGQVEPSSNYYDQAQQMIQQYSELLLEKANSQYWQPVDQLEQALKTISTIPATSPTFQKALEQSQEWRQTWADNARHLTTARQALEQKQWAIALRAVQAITDHPFWLLQKHLLSQTVQQQQQQQQQQYAEYLELAEALLERSETVNAILAARQLPDSSPWSERKQQLIARAEAKQRQISLCRRFSLGLLSCY